MNVVVLSGRLTKDPVMGQTKNGKKFCNFHVAVPGRTNDSTNFPLCQAWGGLAEYIVKYFKKGSKIELDGEISTQTYKNTNGDSVYSQKIVATRANFGESKKSFAEYQASEDIDRGAVADAPVRLNIDEHKAAATMPESAKSIDELADDFMAIPDGSDSEVPFI